MRIAIGADHAGFPLKEDLAGYLREQGHDVLDVGTDGLAPVDYPLFCAAAARAVVAGRPTGRSSSEGRAKGSRSPRTRCTGSGPRCVMTSTWRGCPGSTTMRTSWRWGRA